MPLLQVYPKSHPHHKCIFFDTDEKQYYNARTDIYFDDEDILYSNLRPIELINTSIPQDEDHFTNWHRGEVIKEKALDAIRKIGRIYPTINIYDEPAERLAEEIVLICKSLCPIQTWSSQSVASTHQD
jgi:hypothetical protein